MILYAINKEYTYKVLIAKLTWIKFHEIKYDYNFHAFSIHV